MFKKLICMVLVMQGCGLYAGPVVESFDWGPGVPGREFFTIGWPVQGVRVQYGDVVFRKLAEDSCNFSGESGPGRGMLSMKGKNNAVGFDYPVSGTAVMKAEGRFYPGDIHIRGFWIGFQSATPDNLLLSNQSTDCIFVQVSFTGNIILRSVIGGITTSAVGSAGPIRFSPGDLVKIELAVDTNKKTAMVTVTGAGADNVKVRKLQWSSDKTPDLGTAVINQTGYGEVQVDSVEVRAETLTVG